MFGQAPTSTGLDSLTGAVLWPQLQRAREDLELAFVLLLSRAGAGPIPCAEVERYNELVAAQVALEQRGLTELGGASIYSGLTSPAVIPQVTACQSGEQSIWLRPGQAQQALQGAVRRYQGLLAGGGGGRRRAALLGDAAVPSLVVGGGVLVGWAAQAVAEHVFASLGGSEVQAHEAAVAGYLQLRKAALPAGSLAATSAALASARGRTGLPLGLSVWQSLALAFGAGLVLAGTVWYFWGRDSRAPSLSGSCPRKRRALVME